MAIFTAIKSLNYALEYLMQAGTAKASELFPHHFILYALLWYTLY
jgi:hypothetical protein